MQRGLRIYMVRTKGVQLRAYAHVVVPNGACQDYFECVEIHWSTTPHTIANLRPKRRVTVIPSVVLGRNIGCPISLAWKTPTHPLGVSVLGHQPSRSPHSNLVDLNYSNSVLKVHSIPSIMCEKIHSGISLFSHCLCQMM